MSRALLLLVLAAAPARGDGRPDVVLHWNQIATDTIRAERTPPPAAARALALAHLAAFDTLTAFTLSHRPYRVAVTAPAGASADAAVAAAMHRVLVQLFPRHAQSLDAALADSLAGQSGDGGRDLGAGLGRFVADRILAGRAADGDGTGAPYQPNPLPGVWRPTPSGFRPALLPHWSELATFSGVRAVDLDPGPPPALTSAAYATDLNEVRRLGARFSTVRTLEETEIARFWADDAGTVTPPGHWNVIARSVARRRGHTPAENARLFALLNLALADAAIVCWDCKFKYGLWRPVHAIRHADADGNPDTDADKEWSPLLETPPFPSYTSGHSTFSGAAAAVLADFCDADGVRFTVTSEGVPGVTRSFNSFRAAAEEAGRSRIFGGIHYEFDNRNGLAVGRRVGEAVCRTLLQPVGE